MITTIIILSILLLTSVFVNINQLRKQEAQSDYIEDLENSNTEYYNFFEQLKTKVGQANSQIRNADRMGAFESSDEVGTSFKIIKEVIDDLNKGF
jgi:peptidoglycan hydrolase CwlO-like protein